MPGTVHSKQTPHSKMRTLTQQFDRFVFNLHLNVSWVRFRTRSCSRSVGAEQNWLYLINKCSYLVRCLRSFTETRAQTTSLHKLSCCQAVELAERVSCERSVVNNVLYFIEIIIPTSFTFFFVRPHCFRQPQINMFVILQTFQLCYCFQHAIQDTLFVRSHNNVVTIVNPLSLTLSLPRQYPFNRLSAAVRQNGQRPRCNSCSSKSSAWNACQHSGHIVICSSGNRLR